MSEIVNDFLKLIGGVAAIGAASSAFAYAMFRLFTTKWIETRFAERLEAFKHQQNQEIEHLRFRINTMMDRNVKLHQREFDVLPEMWGLLTDAFNTIEPVAVGYHDYPDLDKMSPEHLEEFLEQSPLTALEKSELKATSGKIQYYRKAIIWHNLNRAVDSYNNFHKEFSKNAIFIMEPIKAKFAEVDEMLKVAVIERQATPQKFEKGVLLHSKGRELLQTLEREVQERLWSSQTVTDARQ